MHNNRTRAVDRQEGHHNSSEGTSDSEHPSTHVEGTISFEQYKDKKAQPRKSSNLLLAMDRSMPVYMGRFGLKSAGK
jgi:hypothetical protein